MYSHEESPDVDTIVLRVLEEIVEDQANGQQKYQYYTVDNPCCIRVHKIKCDIVCKYVSP